MCAIDVKSKIPTAIYEATRNTMGVIVLEKRTRDENLSASEPINHIHELALASL